jgi:hypothetical protein
MHRIEIPGDLSLGHHRIARQTANDLLPRGDVIRQVSGDDRHARIGPNRRGTGW